ncbi:acyltransferase family protein, partial [Enterococcus faecium]
MATWLRPLEAGHFAVGLFLVISGFCLMQPVSKRRAFNIQRYFKRRAGRILPPYFAALVMSLVLIALAPGLRDPTGVRW